ncbi:MAG: iron ABC transporter permease [Candidatus Bathyarchaeota archaeon]|nr:iron ABC transporter permease [Candidatus Bathyarchaeota archaeon]
MSSTEIKTQYTKAKARKFLALFLVFIALIITIILSISLGAGSPRFSEAANVIFSRAFPFLNIAPENSITQFIIMDVRLPRVCLAILAGAGLASSGATMQGVLRNPLVSSYILGISSAAGFGAALAIVFGVSVFTPIGGYVVVGNAFVFSLLAMFTVYGIARVRSINTETVILAGVAVGFLFSALLSLVQFVAPEYEALRSVVFWLMGGLGSAKWQNILIILPIIVVTLLLMSKKSWDLNVMSLGEEVATSVGVNSKRTLTVCMVLATLATASIIAFTGVIGFVCLISPHISRMMIGSDHRFLIPCSVLVGSVLLLGSDTVARLVLAPTELPVGIVTSLLGVPFFIYMLLSKRRQSWR